MTRRANGEGTISKRKDGRYMGRYWIHTATGPKRKTIYGRKGEKREQVHRKLTEAMAGRDRGLVFDAESLTLGGYLDRWLTDSVQSSVKVSTFENYSYVGAPPHLPRVGRVEARSPHRYPRPRTIPGEARRGPLQQHRPAYPPGTPPCSRPGRPLGSPAPQRDRRRRPPEASREGDPATHPGAGGRFFGSG